MEEGAVRSRFDAGNGELRIYPGTEKGLPPSPSCRRQLTLPIKIGIRNGVREARMPQAIVPLPGPAALVVDPDGSLYHLDLRGDANPRQVGRVPPGTAFGTFDGVPLPGGRVLFGWATGHRIKGLKPGRLWNSPEPSR